MPQQNTLTIDKFLGANKSSTETLLQPGEASNMINWMITDDNKLQKVFGYAKLFASLGECTINGMWYGELSDIEHFIFACGGHLYEHNLTTHENTDIGTIADTNPTTIFANNNAVYILDGTDYYKWTGTGNISTVVGYVPTVVTASAPTGGGTLLESINYLNGQKTQKFSGNGSATVYQLLETNIASVDVVKVGGVTKTVTTDYTVNLSTGKVTFVSAPATGVNNVEITWTKVDATDRPRITKNKYFGGIYYSRLWLFGNPDYKNTRFVSGITIAGVSDPEYWPKFADSNVGKYQITAIVTQYDKQLIFTSGDSSEASAWYSVQETYTDANSGIVVTIFPVYPINAKIGHIAPGQVQIIENNPYTIWKGIYRCVSTYVMNEKNAEWMSKRIQNDLDDLDLSQALTIDWNERGIYMLCVGKKVWCYNYRVDAWYILELAHTPTCFLAVDGALCFGTDNGEIMRFDKKLVTFDGEEIVAEWEMGYFNFGVDWLRKFIQRLFISILPYTSTHVDIYVSTDLNAAFQYVGTASYSLSSFETWDFSTFSFEVNYSPQPFKKKLRANKIDYLKIKLITGGTDTATILSLTLPTRIGGEVKNRR
jgi:hypothetical protein